MWAADHAEYLASARWQKVRAPIIARANGHCEKCGKATKRLQVNHLTYARSGGDELPTDLEAVCGHCHLVYHGLAKPRKRKKIRMGPHPPKGFSRIRKRLERQKKKGKGIWADARKDALVRGLVKNGAKLIDPTNWTPPNRSKRK